MAVFGRAGANLRTPAHFRTKFKGSFRTRGVDDWAFRWLVVRSGGVARPPAAPTTTRPISGTESVAAPASLCPRTNAFGIGDSTRSRKRGFDEAGLVEHDHMVQALAPDGTDDPFDIRPLPRASRCRENFMDPHVGDLLAEFLSEDGVAIAQQIARDLLKRKTRPAAAVRSIPQWGGRSQGN